MKAPRAALLCALTIALFLTGRAQESELPSSEATEESEGESTDVTQKVEPTDEDTPVISTVAALTTETVTEYENYTSIGEEDTQLELILMVLIPLVVLALLLLSVVLIVINYKRKKSKQELPSSQGSQSVLQTCPREARICLIYLFNSVAWRWRGQTLEPH
ncbi:transmembrane protein 154 isoform X2 [Myotis daubentonii]|uniref:transmembrane protein 154 isoform X2 n=1 Tax=Myotis daubentonii TaxID=98922 RepID=UPI0028734013|nr:transmembrane protein 154 isoform X2 [Myotis daubentonii]